MKLRLNELETRKTVKARFLGPLGLGSEQPYPAEEGLTHAPNPGKGVELQWPEDSLIFRFCQLP